MLRSFNFSWTLIGNYYYYSYAKDEETEFFILEQVNYNLPNDTA